MDSIEAPICINSTTKPSRFVKNNNQSKSIDVALSSYSPKDAKWDRDRAITQSMSELLFQMQRFERWAERMNGCTRTVGFGEVINPETGEINKKVIDTFFCNCRHCTMCDGRKALVRMGRFREQLPRIEQEYPKARWIMLTLTVPNMPVGELRGALGEMNKAWQRFIKRKQFKPVLGWIRATEVTQEDEKKYGRKNYAHPHFHVLMLVPQSMFGKNYVKHAEWLQMWRSCMRDESIQNVDVRTIKGGAMKGAVETLKAFNYSMKVDDLISRTPEFILEYMEQVEHLRFIAAGGVLKDALKKIDEPMTTEDMLNVDSENEELKADKVVARFTWRPSERKYRMKKDE